MSRAHRFLAVVAVLAIALTTTLDGIPQIRLPRIPRNVPKEIPRFDRLPSLDDLLNRQPLTSSLDDAVTDVPFLDHFNPQAGSPLLELPFGFDDGVTLVPGLWSASIQSYCLKAGTFGPTRGDGYLWAPLKGPKAEIINAILNRSAQFPDLPQRDVQVLLWGIIARSRVSDLDAGPRRAAEILLNDSQLASIDGSALDVIPDDWLRKVTGPIEGPVRRALEAENRLRQAMANPGATAYHELERIAVLQGVPPREERGREVPGGRWSWHPGGFFIRFLPNSYTNLQLQIYSPERFIAQRNGELLTELRDVAGATLRVEYSGTNVSRASFTPAAGMRRELTLGASVDKAEAVSREAVQSVLRLLDSNARQLPIARDVADVARIAATISDEEASAFLYRAWASAAGDWARTVPSMAALERARYQSASLGGLFALPLEMPSFAVQSGLGWGGGGGGAGGGGGGGAMPGGGRQRLGPSLRKFGDDNSIDRARRAVDMFGKGNNALSVATDPAGFFGMSIPDALFGKILDFNFDTWEKASGALAGDPPRDDFQEFTKPSVPEVPKIAVSGEVTAERAERLNALARDLLTANAHLQAAIVALDRHGGAVKNGDRVWATRQAHALTFLKREAGLLTLKVVEHLEAISKDAPRSDARTLMIDGMRELGTHFASLPAIGAPW